MEFYKQLKQVSFNSFPKELEELRWKTIRTRCLVVFHLEHRLSNFLFAELITEKLILYLRHLRNVLPSVLI